MIINLNKVPEGVRENNKHKIIHLNLAECYITHYLYLLEKSYYTSNYDVYLLYPGHTSFLNNFSIEEYVPNDVLNRIRNKEVILAFELSHDSYYSIVDKIYEKIVLEYKIEPSQILLIMGSPALKDYILTKAKELNLDPIRYECFSYWEKMIKLSILADTNLDQSNNTNIIPNIKSPLLNDSPNKKYLSMTRLWRDHKGLMLMLLENENLLDDGYVSFSKMGDWDLLYDDVYTLFQDPEIHQKIANGRKLKDKLPLIIDTNKFELYHLTYFTRSLLSYYNNTYFSLVNETHFLDKHPFFPSEKTFKPIFHKHPFIIVSTSHFLRNLREQGYRTFDGFIDESYDEEIDMNKRYLKIVKEVKRLCNLNPNELIEFKKGCLEIVEYNFNSMMNKTEFAKKLI